MSNPYNMSQKLGRAPKLGPTDILTRYKSRRKNPYLRMLGPWNWCYKYPWESKPKPFKFRGVPVIGGPRFDHLRPAKQLIGHRMWRNPDLYWPGFKLAVFAFVPWVLYDQYVDGGCTWKHGLTRHCYSI